MISTTVVAFMQLSLIAAKQVCNPFRRLLALSCLLFFHAFCLDKKHLTTSAFLTSEACPPAMDPLSITAGALAVLGALTATGKGTNRLLSLRKAPAELLALSNEAEALRRLLLIVQTTLRPINGTPTYNKSSGLLVPLLDRAQDAVLELQTMVEFDLKRSEELGPHRLPKVSWIKWMTAGPAMERLKQTIRDARDNLDAGLAALHLQSNGDVRRTALQIQSVQLTQVEMLAGVRNIQQELPATLQTMIENAISPGLEGLSSQMQRLNASLQTSSGKPGEVTLAATDVIPPSQSDTIAEGHQSICITATMPNQQCPRFCKCHCHRQSYTETPKLLRTVLGQLMCSYNSLIWTKPCDYPPCRTGARKMQLKYYFPAWIVSRAIVLAGTCHDLSGTGAKWSLQVPIIVSQSEDVIWNFVENGNLSMLQKRLMANAQLLNIRNEYGRTLLHVRTYGPQCGS